MGFSLIRSAGGDLRGAFVKLLSGRGIHRSVCGVRRRASDRGEEADLIKIKGVYSQPHASDGLRILVERIWPRDLKRSQTRIDEWRWDLAPTAALRQWFHHDVRKWSEFKTRYRNELHKRGKIDELRKLADQARRQTITLLFAARDKLHNSAVVLKEMLDELM